MAAKFLVIFLLAIAAQTLGDSITDGTTLVSTFLIHRHGDRTPVESSLSFSTDSEALEEASAPYGYGQLTNLGKQRAYNLGKFIRSRYNELLSERFNTSEIYIRSTDSTRAKMTVLTAMAAVYPTYPESWSNQINWVPTPYTTVPAKYDFNMAIFNCPVFTTAYSSALYSNSANMAGFFDVLNVISEQLGFNITSMPNMVYAVYDVYVSQNNIGVPLSDAISAILPGISDAADVAMDNIFGDDSNIRLFEGALLNEFFTYADEQIDGTDTPRVRIYSAHDANVYGFMAVSQITPRQGVPKYASSFSLELRKVDETEEYVVLPVYQPSPSTDGSPGAELLYLPVAGCGDTLLCPYDTFKDIVSSYVVDEDTWRSDCGFTEDLVIDTSSVAK